MSVDFLYIDSQACGKVGHNTVNMTHCQTSDVGIVFSICTKLFHVFLGILQYITMARKGHYKHKKC